MQNIFSLGARLQEGPKGPRRTTDRQRRAARRNGARSRGPVTAAGKARVARNAVRHGLLAAIYRLADDGRGHDVLYRRLRRELHEQYDPRSCMERETIDGLAFEMLQLARARSMAESLSRVTVSPADVARMRQVREARHDLKTIDQARRMLSDRATSPLPAQAAGRIAQRVARYVVDLEENLRPSEDTLPVEEMDAFEREEYRQLQAAWGTVEPLKMKLADTDTITALLTGTTRISPKLRRCLHAVLGTIQGHLRGWIAGQAGVEQRVVAQHDAALHALAMAPQGLMLLQRYITRLENAVERKLRRLEGR